VIGVFRHGDRTPKQKMKMKVRKQHAPFTHKLHLYHLYGWVVGFVYMGCTLVHGPPCVWFNVSDVESGKHSSTTHSDYNPIPCVHVIPHPCFL
jgi:hypothetical protein